MVVINKRRKVLREGIIGREIDRPDILPRRYLIVIYVEIPDDGLVMTIRNIGLEIKVTAQDALFPAYGSGEFQIFLRHCRERS